MKSVRIHYCGPLGLAAGAGSEVVPVNGDARVGDFVETLA